MENALPTSEATARVLVISADDEVKTFINNLMRINRIRAGLTDSIENASHFLNTNVPPDAVILDLEPSENLALEFLRQIRRHETLIKLPVLVLMPIPDPTLVRQALDAGANRYLTKAFMSQNLLPTIQEMLKQNSAHAAPPNGFPPPISGDQYGFRRLTVDENNFLPSIVETVNKAKLYRVERV